MEVDTAVPIPLEPQLLRFVDAYVACRDVKKAALEGMIKTAKLDDAQKNRIIDYWINDLQYGDEEWVRNWVNKNYD